MLLHEINEKGFAIIPNVLSEEEIQQIASRISLTAPRRSRAGIRHALKLPVVAELARHPKLLNLVQKALGPDSLPIRATLFDKSRISNWLVAWHQDTALPLRKRRDILGWGPWSVKEGVVYANAPEAVLSQVLALRVHLDDSTAQNGALRVLPATHSLGVLENDRILDLSKKIDQVECEIPAAGILAMRPLLVHASSKSISEVRRRIIHIEYAASTSIAAPHELALP